MEAFDAKPEVWQPGWAMSTPTECRVPATSPKVVRLHLQMVGDVDGGGTSHQTGGSCLA